MHVKKQQDIDYEIVKKIFTVSIIPIMMCSCQ